MLSWSMRELSAPTEQHWFEHVRTLGGLSALPLNLAEGARNCYNDGEEINNLSRSGGERNAKMRTMFPGYYRPTEEEFKKMWQECIFSFDANVPQRPRRGTM
jgi:hypothetical protein